MATETHMPRRDGPVCGKFPKPTDAAAYTLSRPSCEKCAKYYDAVNGGDLRAAQPASPTVPTEPAPEAPATAPEPTTGTRSKRA